MSQMRNEVLDRIIMAVFMPSSAIQRKLRVVAIVGDETIPPTGDARSIYREREEARGEARDEPVGGGRCRSACYSSLLSHLRSFLPLQELRLLESTIRPVTKA